MAKLGEVCLINPKSCTLRDDTEVSFIPMTKLVSTGSSMHLKLKIIQK